MSKVDIKSLSGHARKRIYLALPYIGSLLASYGIVEQSKVALWVGAAGVILGPLAGHYAASNVPPDNNGDGTPDTGG